MSTIMDSARSRLLVDLNRRVRVRGTAEPQQSVRSVDDLRSCPFVVILGEPGIGKSSILSREAVRHGASVVTMRGLIEGERPDASRRLFVDALDEYRSGGNRSAMTTDVIKLIRELRVTEIWLACRTEDWRPQVDDVKFPRAVSARDAVMAEVLPLAWAEANTLLSAWGEPNAQAFLGQAWVRGISSFTENPLSLRLLQKAVGSMGHWPETRFSVFDEGIRNLSREHDPEREARFRPSEVEIRTAAATACLMLLLTGKRAIWKPGGSPTEVTSHLTAADLGLSPTLLSWVLDTPLFRGEGSSFQTMHRFVAEFLAAEALAKLVRPEVGIPALPMPRALALMSGDDRVAPTELRGLYAWFAAHLAQRGGYNEATQLAENDAATVLTYGDPAVLDTTTRRVLLANLARRDPYILNGELGPTSIAGLSGDDLAPEFEEILRAGPDASHRVHVVLNALSHGNPVATLQPLLSEMALDPARPGWLRDRALEAFLHGVSDPGEACFDLLTRSESEPISEGRAQIRTMLVSRLNNDELTPAVVLKLLRERLRKPGLGFHGSLFSLQQRLTERPMPGLFEAALKDPQSTPDPLFQDHEALNLLDHALAACIASCCSDDAAQIWHWAKNVQHYGFEPLPEQAQQACKSWISDGSENEAKLFRAILDDLANEPGFMIANRYVQMTGLSPSLNLVNALAQDAQAVDARGQKAASAVASAVFQCDRGIEAWDKLYENLVRIPEHAAALEALTQCNRQFVPGMEEFHDARVRAVEREVEAVRQAIANLAPHLDALRQGRGVTHALYHAAVQFYYEPRTDNGRFGADRVDLFVDTSTRDAILEGWEHIALHGLGSEIDPGSMGRLAAKNSAFHVEIAALAGVDRLMERRRLPPLAEVPIEVALAVARNLHIVSDVTRRERLERWTWDRLDVDPQAGGKLLRTFWEAMADDGALDLRSAPLHTTASGRVAIASLLTDRSDLNHPCLLSAIGIAAGFMDRRSLFGLATAASQRNDLEPRPKAVWSLISHAMDDRPLSQSDLDRSAIAGDSWPDLSEVVHLLLTLSEVRDAVPGQIAALTFKLTASQGGPDAISSGGGFLGENQEHGFTAHRALNIIAACNDPDMVPVLECFADDERLQSWQPSIRHALATQERARRDAAYVHPTPERVRDALRGGSPATSADLKAVVVEELWRLRSDVRQGDLQLWVSFWNTEGEKAKIPRVENLCRDQVLALLRPRLERFGIIANPEAQRAERTRADVLAMTYRGDNVPLEVKRQQHPNLWTAAGTQLREYGMSPNAARTGVYLVLWFGADQDLPSRPDGGAKPTSAADLERMLKSDLPEDLVDSIEVVVFDVSHPEPPDKRRRRRNGNSDNTPKKINR